jgi:hypothetical protein
MKNEADGDYEITLFQTREYLIITYRISQMTVQIYWGLDQRVHREVVKT